MEKEQLIACLDLKAFYSYVECLDRKLDPFQAPLVVCDDERGEGTIVLSVSPYLKSQGVPSRLRKRDLPKRDDLIFARPRMSRYIEMSSIVTSILLDFVGEDDLHIYSIDESFINLTPYLRFYNLSPYALVKEIIKTINKKTGLKVSAGISENMFLAKCALEFEGKKTIEGIAYWHKNDIKTKLWPIKPLSSMWGISSRLEKRLNDLGITTIGELANASEELLIKYFGVIGKDLKDHANGIDYSNIREKYIPQNTSLACGQCLFRDYSKEESATLIREMCDDLSRRLRRINKKANTVSLTVGYTYEFGGGFSRQLTLTKSTNDEDSLFEGLLILLRKHCKNVPIRRISISFCSLEDDNFEQLDLFNCESELRKKRSLREAFDNIVSLFGKDAILRASALLEHSTIKLRHAQIGGHRR
ncbi:MAG: damage repair protein [Bacilli bacterium]|jgi:DNA polymerase V|nr:damage repair protein [Bacilli bacterium]